MPRKHITHGNPYIETITYGVERQTFYKKSTKNFLDKPLYDKHKNNENYISNFEDTIIEWLNPDDLKMLDMPFEKITNNYIKFLKSIKEFEQAKYWLYRNISDNKNEETINNSKTKMDKWYNIINNLLKSAGLNFTTIISARKDMYKLYKK